MKQQPFHYVANLKEAGAEIEVEFFPDVDLVNVYFVKGGKKHVLSMFNNNLEGSYLYTIDKRTDNVKCYNVEFDEDLGVQANDEIGDEESENEED